MVTPTWIEQYFANYPQVNVGRWAFFSKNSFFMRQVSFMSILDIQLPNIVSFD